MKRYWESLWPARLLRSLQALAGGARGTHVVVSPGVTIGKGSVIGANSVVTRNVPPYSVVAGSPARRIAQRLDWDPQERLDMSKATDWPYILSGTGDPATGLLMSPGEPLLVAVRGSELRICLDCRGSGSLLVNGQAFELSPGTTQLDVRAAPPDAMGATLRIEASDPPAELVFTSFSSLP